MLNWVIFGQQAVLVASGSFTGTGLVHLTGGLFDSASWPFSLGASVDQLVVTNGAGTDVTVITPAGDIAYAAGTFTVRGFQSKPASSTTPTSNQVWAYNSGAGQWQPTSLSGLLPTLAGDVTGAPGSNTVVQLTGSASSVAVIANTGLTAATGTGFIDFHLATGATKLPTGNLSWAGASTKTASIVSTGAAITVTAGAASTWSTSAGALTVSGFTGITLQKAGTTYADVGTTTGSVVTLGAGISLAGVAGAGALSLGSMTGVCTLPTGNLSWTGASGSTVSIVASGTSASITLTANAASSWTTTFGNITIDPSNALNLGNTNATSVAIGHSTITTTVTGGLSQLSGALNLTANAASQVTTSSGALTLSSSAAATWGVLTSGALSLTGVTGVNLQVGGSTFVGITSTQVTFGAGITLVGTAGSGGLTFGSMTGNTTLPTGSISWTGASTKSVSLVSTGAGSSITITAGAASTWSTSSGGLTLTSAAAATWSTSAGALTVSGFAGINLQTNGTTQLDLGVTTGSTVTVAANINLAAAAGTTALSFGSATGATTLPTGSIGWTGASTKTVSLVSTGVGSSITITAGAASTWSTSAGALTVDSAAALNLGTSAATSIAVGKSGITTTITGGLTQLTGAVSLTGNGASSFTTSAGALTLTSAAAATWSTSAGALTVDAFAALNLGTSAATSIAIGKSGVTTTITGGLTQLTGAVSITGNAASSLTTSSGALTLTSAAAATWSTSAGALTLTSAAAATWSTSAGALTVSGFAGLNLAKAGTTYEDLGVTTGSTITWAAGISIAGAAGAGALSLGSMTGNTALPTGSLSWAGASTKTVSLVSTGAGSSITLTAGAASTWSTSAGALTITSAAAATWSTAAGALTLSGFSALVGQVNGTTLLDLSSTTANTVTMSGAVVVPQRTVTSSQTVDTGGPGAGGTDYTILVNTATAVTMTLANPTKGRRVCVKALTTAPNITIARGSANIDNVAQNILIQGDYVAVTLEADGTNWWSVA